MARTCHLNDDIDRRPDVAAARGQVDIAERKVHEAELLFSPTLSFGSQFADNNVAVLGPTKTWDVEGLLNVPLYDGGARYGVLRDARAAAEQARQNLVATRLNAIVGSAQAQRLVGVRQAARDVSKRTVDLDQRIDDRTRNGYANGFGNSLDLVTSAQDLRQARDRSRRPGLSSRRGTRRRSSHQRGVSLLNAIGKDAIPRGARSDLDARARRVRRGEEAPAAAPTHRPRDRRHEA